MSEVIDSPQAFMKYSDATYDYYCEAPPRTALIEAFWTISRIHNTTLREEWAANTAGNLHNNLATDLATVAALDFA